MAYGKTICLIIALTLLATGSSLSKGNYASKEKLIWRVIYSDQNNQDTSLALKVRKKENTEQTEAFFHTWQKSQEEGLIVKLTYLKVEDNYAWFAGKCTEDKSERGLKDRWLFIVVHDGGKPGKLVDHLWCEWLKDTNDAEKIARRKVENLEKPKKHKPIKEGDIVVDFDSYRQVKAAK